MEYDGGRELILLLQFTVDSFLLQAVWGHNTVLCRYVLQITSFVFFHVIYKRTGFYYTGFDFTSFKTPLCNLYENVDYTKSKSPYLLFPI